MRNHAGSVHEPTAGGSKQVSNVHGRNIKSGSRGSAFAASRAETTMRDAGKPSDHADTRKLNKPSSRMYLSVCEQAKVDADTEDVVDEETWRWSDAKQLSAQALDGRRT